MKNIFVEGIPGTGKSTLLKELQKNLHNYNVYYEGDISPIDLAWCSYMTKEQYEKAVKDWPQLEAEIRSHTKQEDTHYIVAYTHIQTNEQEFYRCMEAYELYGGRRSIDEFSKIVWDRFVHFQGIGNVFECSFFQNIIEELMLFAEYNDSQILEFYNRMIVSLHGDFLVIRLVTHQMENSLLQIKQERVNDQGEEVWYHAMMNYLNDSPYGKAHQFKEFSDIMKHFDRRIALEKKIADELLHNRFIEIESKNYRLEDISRLLS